LPGGAALPPLVSAFVTEEYVRGTLSSVFAPQAAPTTYMTSAGVMMATRVTTLRANARQVNTLRPHVVEMSERYGGIALPVEILHGSADRTVYKEIHAEPLAAALPNANLTILDGIGHMPHHVAQDDVIAAIHRAALRAGLR
jgi:pimeloyl-ACP methyl ester carboxylesterase